MRHPATRITIFNHKGGVGKTVLTVNIGAALASLGKRVLLVDSDPQCNLTSYIFRSKIVDKLLDASDGPHGRTIWTALKPVAEGAGDVRSVRPASTFDDNLMALPGDIKLSEFEACLNTMWAECIDRKVRGFRGTTALSALVNQLAQAENFDFVFYDAGPNIGPLNRVILLDCDFFIIPAACDLFSMRALNTLGQTLATWIRSWQRIMELAPSIPLSLPGKPQFMGYIPQQFRVYGQAMTRSHSYYVSQFEKHIYGDVISVLREVDESLAPPKIAGTKLGEVKHFGELVLLSQAQGLPLSMVSGSNSSTKAQAKAAFEDIARRIVAKTGKR